MTKKNLKPQQAAPVQREINTTSSVGGTGLAPATIRPILEAHPELSGESYGGKENPFAGDDAE